MGKSVDLNDNDDNEEEFRLRLSKEWGKVDPTEITFGSMINFTIMKSRKRQRQRIDVEDIDRSSLYKISMKKFSFPCIDADTEAPERSIAPYSRYTTCSVFQPVDAYITFNIRDAYTTKYLIDELMTIPSPYEAHQEFYTVDPPKLLPAVQSISLENLKKLVNELVDKCNLLPNEEDDILTATDLCRENRRKARTNADEVDELDDFLSALGGRGNGADNTNIGGRIIPIRRLRFEEDENE